MVTIRKRDTLLCSRQKEAVVRPWSTCLPLRVAEQRRNPA